MVIFSMHLFAGKQTNIWILKLTEQQSSNRGLNKKKKKTQKRQKLKLCLENKIKFILLFFYAKNYNALSF